MNESLDLKYVEGNKSFRVETGRRNSAIRKDVIKYLDLPEKTGSEIVELVVRALERHLTRLDMACKVIKKTLDQLYNPGWHVSIGHDFSFHLTSRLHHTLYLHNGSLGVLIWKSP